MQTSTLRPGFLVSLKTSVRGNVSYQRKDIEAEHKTEDGKAMARWETERVIADATEHDAAIKARTKARVMVTSVCTASAFGLLCPESAAEELEKAIEGARQVAESFNAEAKLTRLSVYVITGRIAQDDVEAVKAINSEIRDLLSDMQEGIGNCDAKAVREAASKARSLGSMLSFDAAAKVQIAIEAARKSAREIVKAGEQAAQEVDKQTIAMLAEARTAFLDLDESGSVVAAPVMAAPAVDLAPSDVVKTSPAAVVPALEME